MDYDPGNGHCPRSRQFSVARKTLTLYYKEDLDFSIDIGLVAENTASKFFWEPKGYILLDRLGKIGYIPCGTTAKSKFHSSAFYKKNPFSRAVYRRFYEGFQDVALPHKFKIAVGGCPNNCVKPNLNDVGIIGQRIPEVNSELCKGCKMRN